MSLDSWFVSEETERLSLPGATGDWIEAKRELEYGEARKLESAAVRTLRQQTDDSDADRRPEFSIDLARFDRMKLKAWIVSWSLRLPNGKPAPITDATIDKLSAAKARVLMDTLDGHIARMEAIAAGEQETADDGGKVVTISSPPSTASS